MNEIFSETNLENLQNQPFHTRIFFCRIESSSRKERLIMATYAAFKHVELYNVGSGKRRLVKIRIKMREKSSRKLYHLIVSRNFVLQLRAELNNYSG